MTKLLLVEDDHSVADALQLLLEANDYAVHVERDGLNGFARATQQDFSLLIVDVDLPLMDGMQLCRKLRQERHATPIIMLTGRTHEADRMEGLGAGANAYLTKPFQSRDLLDKVKLLTCSHFERPVP